MLNFKNICFIYALFLILIYLSFDLNGVLYLILSTFTLLVLVRVLEPLGAAGRASLKSDDTDGGRPTKSDSSVDLSKNNIAVKTLKDIFHSLLNTSTSGKTKNMNNSFTDWRRLSFRSSGSPQTVKSKVGVSRSRSFSSHLLSPSGYHQANVSSPRGIQRKVNTGNITRAAGPLLSGRFLPTVKRALGLDDIPKSPITVREESQALFPGQSHPGFVPTIRLGRKEKHKLDNSFSSIRSPNTVRIAPPDPHQVMSPRLFQVKENINKEKHMTPDTQAVVTALKEKSRKRALDGTELPYPEMASQTAKRRRQESQQSNASTSSLPPLPDDLPDLSTKGYTIPRLQTPTLKSSTDSPSLKRTAHMSNLADAESNDQSGKRVRTDNVYNSIVSSLSSSRKLRQQSKRKAIEEKENEKESVQKSARRESNSFSMQRADTVILPPDFNETANTSQISTSEDNSTCQEDISPATKPSMTPKRVSLNETFSARKRQMSLYSGLNKSFKKVPQTQVVASMADYEKDRLAEQSRGKQLLESLAEDEKGQENPAPSAAIGQSTAAPTPISTSIVTTSVIGQSIAPSSKLQTSLPAVGISSSQILPVSSVTTAGGITLAVSSGLSTSASVLLTSNATSKSNAPADQTSSSGTTTIANSSSNFSFGLTASISSSSQPSNTSSVSPISTVAISDLNTSTTASKMPLAGISFGQSASSAAANLSAISGFSFRQTGAAPTSSSAGAADFTFGLASKSIVPSSTSSVGQTSSLTSPSAAFSFGSTAVLSSQPVSSRAFGSTTVLSSQPLSSTAFGSTAVLSSQPVSSTAFGSTAVLSSQPLSSTASLASSQFGVAMKAAPSPGILSFGQSTVTSTNTSGFTFGSTQPTSDSKSVSAFNTASSAPASTATNMVFGSSVLPGFGQKLDVPSTSAGPGGFNFKPISDTAVTTANTFGSVPGFGSSSSLPSTTSNSLFPFGQSKPAPPTALTGSSQFTFGQTLASTQVSSSSQLPKPVFGQTSSTPVFSQSTSSAGTSFGQPTKPAPIGGFNFGGTTSASSAFTTPSPAFGNPVTTSVSPVFGATAVTQGNSAAFGVQSGLPKPTFGSVPTGNSFGSNSSNQSSTFGLGTSFGSSAPSSVFQFGQQNSITHSSSVFAAAPPSSTTSSNAAPVFGQSASINPSVVPSFGSSTANFGTPGGTSSTPFPFGMSTPQKNISANGFNFGTPQNQTVSVQNQSTPATGSKGFDFGAAAGSGNSSFSFGQGSTSFGTAGAPTQFGTGTPGAPPSFGSGTPGAPAVFGTGTPGAPAAFGTPTPGGNMFSVGSAGNSAAKRQTARARRRGTKK